MSKYILIKAHLPITWVPALNHKYKIKSEQGRYMKWNNDTTNVL